MTAAHKSLSSPGSTRGSREKSLPPGDDPRVAGDGRPDEGARLDSAIDALDWAAIEADLDAIGCAVAPGLLPPEVCREVAATYGDESRFRSTVVMARHGFGRGEYKYFADRWNEMMRVDVRYPAEHEAFRARCHAAGQIHPTPLLLRYGPGDYNCLHQDVYGSLVFPLQVAILLSEPSRDFSGGEFVLTEQRPRMQSRRGRESSARRRGDLRRARAPGQRRARRLPGRHAARREPLARRPALHPRDHFPRRGVTGVFGA
jgi:hypothetical protein